MVHYGLGRYCLLILLWIKKSYEFQFKKSFPVSLLRKTLDNTTDLFRSAYWGLLPKPLMGGGFPEAHLKLIIAEFL